MPSVESSAAPTSVPVINVSRVDDSRLGRRLFLSLGAIALIYAFLAGLATVGDPDTGWHLATGRWVVQHHQVFSNDVFSYTKPDGDGIYPAGSGLILYGVYLLGGYSLLSWLCALSCLAAVALLLRRGSAVSAAIAIVAMPFIAYRTAPRAELFTIVLFAAYLSLLWENYQTNRVRLWLLPLLMLFWVNLHPGFLSGLGLLVAFAGIDGLEMLLAQGARRSEALQRLKREVPWFLATAAVTLVNPWGWRFYPALARYIASLRTMYINEWAPLSWNWTGSLRDFSLRNTSDSFHLLLVIVALGIVAAIAQRRLGAAILLVGAIYEAGRHVRMVAAASCLIVVIGGSVIASAMPWIRARISSPRLRTILATAAAVVFAALATVRATDLVTNHHYLAERNLSTFGAGLSGWFPRNAAEFIRDQNLPGEVLNTFNEGGYTLWALGPDRRDYIDGRAVPFGDAFAHHGGELLATPLDSELWRQEADRYGITTIIFPLTLDEISLARLRQDCDSKEWRPVFLDEVSIVLLRRKPETEDLIRRFEVNCTAAPIPREPLPRSAGAFNEWVNAARVLSALGRNTEALSAADQAMAIFPDNAHARWYRGQVLYAMGRHYDAEKEWQRALALAPSEVTPWGSLPDFQAAVLISLADLYQHLNRPTETIDALQRVSRLTSDKNVKLQAAVSLGQVYTSQGQPYDAEKQWLAALSLDPKQGSVWLLLADSYKQSGQFSQAIQALQQGIPLASDPQIKAASYLKLGLLYLRTRQPKNALQALDDATRNAPAELLSAKGTRSFSFDVAQARAASWMGLGDLKQATTYEEQAVQLDPEAADAWSHLAKLYQRQGRTADQQRAEQRSKTLTAAGQRS